MNQNKSYQIIEIYTVRGSDGSGTGLGPIIGCFSSKNKADVFALGKGWYGSDGTVSKKYAILIDGEYFLLEKQDPIKIDFVLSEDDKIKESALSKLTNEEKKILGLM